MEQRKNAGNFIVFEGIDGSGKTTQAELLAKALGDKAFLTNEPTNSPLGVFIRMILEGTQKFNDKALQYLFTADRAEHIYGEGGIIEQVKRGKIIVCDRYIPSSLAYNSQHEELLERLNEDFPLPSAIIYLRVDPNEVEKVFERVQARDGAKDLFDTIEKQKEVAKKYDELFLLKDNLKNIITIDALGDKDEIAKEILQKVGTY